jgi:hypothetical protein
MSAAALKTEGVREFRYSLYNTNYRRIDFVYGDIVN